MSSLKRQADQAQLEAVAAVELQLEVFGLQLEVFELEAVAAVGLQLEVFGLERCLDWSGFASGFGSAV